LMPQLFPVGLCQKCHAECTRQAANLGEPKQWITTAVEAVTPEMLRLVWAEVSYWLDMLSHEWAHMEIYWTHHHKLHSLHGCCARIG
jgi:hypothetical protein